MDQMKVNVADAKKKLPKLIKAVEGGEQVTICRRGKAVVDIVRTGKAASQKPAFGTLKGQVLIHDADWWKQMSAEEADEFLEGGG